MNESINKWKIAVYVIAILFLFITGFFCGRRTIKQPEPDIIYVPGDTVKTYVEKLIPFKEEVDTANVIKSCVKNGLFYELFPEKVKDSIVYLTLTKEDTAKVFNDWATKRSYSETIFDIDTVGKATFEADVQFNRLMSFNHSFTPVIKQVTKVKPTPKYSLFAGAGVSTLPSVNAGAGFFYGERWGAMLTYQYDYSLKNNIIGSMFLIKF